MDIHFKLIATTELITVIILKRNKLLQNLSSFKGLFGGPLKNQYSLLQFHAHWGCSNSEGSEHLVDNKSYAAEVFFVRFFLIYIIVF
jgi:hypothetical protein